ncbi:MAG: hypothetical protein ACRD0N_02840, partial [Acidimicrobiales bacterium]
MPAERTVPGPPHLPDRLRRLAGRVLPRGSLPRRVGGLAGAAVNEARAASARLKEHWDTKRYGDDPRPPPSYREWCAGHDAAGTTLDSQRHISVHAAGPLRFQVVVVDRPGRDLAATLASLRAQTWGHWESTVVADLTVPPERSGPETGTEPVSISGPEGEKGRRSAGDDPRRWFVVFLFAGDTLAVDCLYEAATAATRDPMVDLVYWDDDVLDGRGGRHAPRFRPSWSPELLLGADFLGHSFAIRRSRLLAAGGLRPGMGDAVLWDLLLRADLPERATARVTRVLGHLAERHDTVPAQG